jgi:hypothetical protein
MARYLAKQKEIKVNTLNLNLDMMNTQTIKKNRTKKELVKKVKELILNFKDGLIKSVNTTYVDYDKLQSLKDEQYMKFYNHYPRM